MTQYVIRSMSTTDYRIASRGYPEELPRPFHIYLMKPERRLRAYWSSYCGDTMVFDTIDDALAHGAACLNKDDDYGRRLGNDRFDVVPRVDLDVPTYWDARKGNPRNRVIGTEIVNWGALA